MTSLHFADTHKCVSVGPGSFTGLRVGCSVAQGLAFGLQKKILPLSSLMVLAQTVFLEHKASITGLAKKGHACL